MLTVIYGPGDLDSIANAYNTDHSPIYAHPFNTLHHSKLIAEMEKLTYHHPHAVITSNNRDVILWCIRFHKGQVRFIRVLDGKYPGTNDCWREVKRSALLYLASKHKEFR